VIALAFFPPAPTAVGVLKVVKTVQALPRDSLELFQISTTRRMRGRSARHFDTAEDLTFTLVKEADGWKVDDVASHNKDFPYSLKAIMEAPLATQ